ncbi:MAG: magnesium chelatase ATPase subunit D, partial [Alphaproteobacteria bacterium HGW-Alphaproteobacteria-2]
MSAGTERWARAWLALALLAVDPRGLGGVVIRARVGPVQQAAVRLLAPLPGPAIRIHPEIDDAQLFGGLDLGATLAVGAPRRFAGVLARAGTLILPTAERIGAGLAARLAQASDRGEAPCLVLLDEGAEPGEAAPAALADRLALHLDLDGIGRLEARGPHPEA